MFLKKEIPFLSVLIVLAAFFFLIAAGVIKAHADPFLLCDPQTGVTQYRLTFDGGGNILEPAQTDGSVKYDISSLTVGSHTGTIEAGAQYTLDGNPQPAWRWSSVVPFNLTVPAIPAVVGIGLSP